MSGRANVYTNSPSDWVRACDRRADVRICDCFLAYYADHMHCSHITYIIWFIHHILFDVVHGADTHTPTRTCLLLRISRTLVLSDTHIRSVATTTEQQMRTRAAIIICMQHHFWLCTHCSWHLKCKGETSGRIKFQNMQVIMWLLSKSLRTFGWCEQGRAFKRTLFPDILCFARCCDEILS